jgi:hypothetical protein
VISIIDSWSMNMPSSRSTPNMTSSMVKGCRSNPVAQASMPLEAPEKARIWLKVAEPSTIMNAMTVTLSAPATARTRAGQVRQRKAAARSSTPAAPNAAASEGVAQPSRIRPITRNTTRPIGRMSVTTRRSLVRQATGGTS